MTETVTQIRVVGNYTINQGKPDDCLDCGHADYGDVIINGRCSRCILGNEGRLRNLIDELRRILTLIQN